MIRAEELRIGNLVTNEFYESFGDIIKVESIHENGINIVASDDNKPYGMASPLLDFEYTFDKLKPIPLTEAWLMKMGFIHDKEYNKSYYTKDSITINIPDKFYTEGRTYFNSWAIIKESPKSVHQLQNLYFALTGQELKIAE